MQMDQDTLENIGLVEEMTNAASTLKSQALELVDIVAIFQLSNQVGDSRLYLVTALTGAGGYAKKARP
ncbi:hypothetical protein [Undibacterium sp. Ji22W]|uniref:hypothetical protein n=1 Tax=Undibacterium sp. Ji22W TaxID=3413038 RepID=UPI003BEFA4B5